mmetsp:Transcript_43454/g.68039  ORF Transcript_43454/g.68039 Transcript_43454/m.68039 type:complete len:313 (+) Transcript_43454:80-1018(+)
MVETRSKSNRHVVLFKPAFSGTFCCLSLLSLLAWLDEVAADEEVKEEHEERDDVDQVDLCNPLGEGLALRVKQPSSLGIHGQELDHLHHGEVLLPPNVLGVHAKEVIGVHDGVDEAVQANGQVDIAVISDIGVDPVHHKDGQMVINVEEGKLLPLLSSDYEKGVEEIKDLRNVEEPKHRGNGCLFPVEWVARDGVVVVAVGHQTSLDGHVRAQHYLRNVVHEPQGVGEILEGRQEVHDDPPKDNEGEVGNRDGGRSGEISKRPALGGHLGDGLAGAIIQLLLSSPLQELTADGGCDPVKLPVILHLGFCWYL